MNLRVQTISFKFGDYGFSAGPKDPDEMAKRVNKQLDTLQEEGYEILAVNLFEYKISNNWYLGGLITVRAEDIVYQETFDRLQKEEEERRKKEHELMMAAWHHERSIRGLPPIE